MTTTSPTGKFTPLDSRCEEYIVASDGRGDVRLLLRQEDQRNLIFVVSSSILCGASKVFQSMLGPSSQFREAKQVALPGTPSQDLPEPIVLEDDCPHALYIVLSIIHKRHESIPPVVSVNELFEIALICDKYTLVEPVIPWIQSWVPKFPLVPITTGQIAGIIYGQLLCIAWVFRLNFLFKMASQYLVQHTIVENACERVDGNLVRIEVLVCDDASGLPDAIPQRVLDALKRERKKLIKPLTDSWIKELDKCQLSALRQGNSCCTEKGTAGKECDTTSLNLLVRFLMREVLPWAKNVRNVNGRSFASLRKAISDMEDLRGIMQRAHTKCGPKMRLEDASVRALSSCTGLDLREFLMEQDIYFSDV